MVIPEQHHYTTIYSVDGASIIIDVYMLQIEQLLSLYSGALTNHLYGSYKAYCKGLKRENLIYQPSLTKIDCWF